MMRPDVVVILADGHSGSAVAPAAANHPWSARFEVIPRDWILAAAH
ncbi:hypothetical protein OCAE111667_02565 [Occultella aeris]|uniref:Uncharacterized protein n=1 Tax=Occultella aeris TaxID=2761496 RepID=A0A7M4DGG8_9MICO|nr:hypothetical protein [Occultella aeris]VZO36011.1 hypothetical protein HALOF300_01215 [Occultella aeris]